MKLGVLDPRRFREVDPVHATVKKAMGEGLAFVGSKFITSGGFLDLWSGGSTFVGISEHLQSKDEEDSIYYRGDRVLILKFRWQRGRGWWHKVGLGELKFNEIDLGNRTEKMSSPEEQAEVEELMRLFGPEWWRERDEVAKWRKDREFLEIQRDLVLQEQAKVRLEKGQISQEMALVNQRLRLINQVLEMKQRNKDLMLRNMLIRTKTS